MGLEKMPVELRLRILWLLTDFDTLISLLGTSVAFRAVFRCYPHDVLQSVYESSSEDYIVTALAVLALTHRMKPTFPIKNNPTKNRFPSKELNKERKKHATLAKKHFPEIVHGFLEIWLAQSKSQSSVPKITFWINAIIKPDIPLHQVGVEAEDGEFTEDAAMSLIRAHLSATTYAQQFSARELPLKNKYREEHSEYKVYDTDYVCSETYSTPTPSEKNRLLQAFYRLWVLCQLLQYRELWNEPLARTDKRLIGYFKGLPTIWDAIAVRVVYHYFLYHIEGRDLETLQLRRDFKKNFKGDIKRSRNTQSELRSAINRSCVQLKTALGGHLDFESCQNDDMPAFMTLPTEVRVFANIPEMRVFTCRTPEVYKDSLPNVEEDAVVWDDWRREIWGYEFQHESW